MTRAAWLRKHWVLALYLIWVSGCALSVWLGWTGPRYALAAALAGLLVIDVGMVWHLGAKEIDDRWRRAGLRGRGRND